MATVVVVHPADAAAGLRQCRDDALVLERADGAGRYVAEDGPFRRYERTLTALPSGELEERTSFGLVGGVWGLLFLPGFRHGLRRRPRRTPWWAPPERLDARAGAVLGLLCSLTLVSGYAGTLLTQTASFASDEFGADTTAQSGALAATRIGVVIAIVLTSMADRVGRRRMVAVAAGAAVVVAATGALSPNLAALTVSQLVARGFATALILLIAIVSAEEMPAGSRAYAYSLLTLSGGLGAGMTLWVLPIADLSDRAWRLLYVLPLLFLPLVRAVFRRLPETRRFERPHLEAPIAGHGRRFWLLAVTGALIAVFAAPASQLLNEYLRDVRGFSATRVSIFTMITVTPGTLGVIVGGRLADVRGRRIVASIGVAGGVAFTVLQFAAPGWRMWGWGIASSVLAGAVVPSLGVYRSELFPTSLRGRLGGIVEGMAVIGSAIGLLAVGSLVDRGHTYGQAFTWLALAPLLVTAIILVAFPETAHRTLEDINPEDQPL